MKKIAFSLAIVASVLSLSACSKAADPVSSAVVASPTCADLPKVSDPAQRAELQKKCPRNGAAFQPSPAKSY